MRWLRMLGVAIIITIICFAGTAVYVAMVQTYDVEITVHSPHQVQATVHQTSGYKEQDDIMLTLDDGVTQTVSVPFGEYAVSFKPDYTLLDDGSIILPHDDMTASATPEDDASLDVMFDTADISTKDDVAKALNRVPSKYQAETKAQYEALEKQARLAKAHAGTDTDQYTVTNIDIGDARTGDVEVSADLTNKTGRTMQWMEVNFDLMDDDDNIIGTARFSSDMFYRGQTSRVTAHGFTSQEVAYAVITNVIWY